MRTTITIQEDLLKKAQQLSGRSGYSEAIVTSLKDYVSLKERLAYLETLFSKKAPHSFRAIKKMRRKKKWSS
ncbi:MAG: type II toxin-antitoxin system VapB family antitoxin [Deltaproteobacteria bacterium]|nr:type II toxin-antitoxin system VapB family antitoxin [Deltaproteobacteria bacterium]